MYTIMRDLPPSVSSPYPPPSDIPLFYRNDLDDQALIEEYKKECMMIRHGVDTDIEKCFEEGKAIIIEGHNLDPAAFIELLEMRSLQGDSHTNQLAAAAAAAAATTTTTDTAAPTTPTATTTTTGELTTATVTPTTETNTTDNSININNNNNNNNTNNNNKEKEKEGKDKKKKTAFSKGIIVPFVLSMQERDHKLLIENWLSCSARDQGLVKNLGADAESQVAALLHRLQLVQKLLCTCVPPFVRVDVNAHAFMETLDVLHSAVLERIQQWYAGDDNVSTE